MRLNKIAPIVFAYIFNFVLSKKVTIQPYKSFKFDKKVPKNHLFKFEYHEENNLNPEVTIIDDRNREILKTNENYCVTHIGSKEDVEFYFEIKNPTAQQMKVYFRVPDCDKEMYSAIGPITEKDILAEFNDALKRNIQEQSEFLSSLTEHENLTKSTHRIVGILVFFEIIFCIGTIYYLHQKTKGLFEKKQRA